MYGIAIAGTDELRDTALRLATSIENACPVSYLLTEEPTILIGTLPAETSAVRRNITMNVRLASVHLPRTFSLSPHLTIREHRVIWEVRNRAEFAQFVSRIPELSTYVFGVHMATLVESKFEHTVRDIIIPTLYIEISRVVLGDFTSEGRILQKDHEVIAKVARA